MIAPTIDRLYLVIIVYSQKLVTGLLKETVHASYSMSGFAGVFVFCFFFCRRAAGASWEGRVPVIQVSSVTSHGFAKLRAFLGLLAPPEPLEAMYRDARGKAAEVRRVQYYNDTTVCACRFVVLGAGGVYLCVCVCVADPICRCCVSTWCRFRWHESR